MYRALTAKAQGKSTLPSQPRNMGIFICRLTAFHIRRGERKRNKSLRNFDCTGLGRVL
jgi:hypothetical protein